MKEFENKVVMVTGASLGIGLQTVKEFAARGARVIMISNNQQSIDEAIATISEGRELVRGYTCELMDANDIARLFRDLRKDYPQIDILVNNVGAFAEKLEWNELSDELWHRAISLNTLCSYHCSVGVTDWLIEQKKKGCIVNIGSSAAIRLKAGRIHYTATKATLHTISQVSALDLAPHGIRVNIVAPGPTATETVQKRIDDPAQSEQEAYRLRKIPLGRYAKPIDIANAVLFLASEKASFITGSILSVDGGYTIGEPF